VTQLRSELVELLLGFRELDLELGRVDALGLGDEDPPPQQLELLHELSVRAPQVVALGDDVRELLTGDSELLAGDRELVAHMADQRLELLLACRWRLCLNSAHARTALTRSDRDLSSANERAARESVNADTRTRRALRCLRQIHTVEQRVEQRLVDFDVPRIRRARLGKAENSTVQAFVEQTHPEAVEEQDFHRVAPLSEVDEQRAAPRLVPDALERRSGQPIERPPHVHGIERHEHLDATRDHRSPPRARTTSDKSPASNPRPSEILAPDTSMTSPLPGTCPFPRARAPGRETTRAMRIGDVPTRGLLVRERPSARRRSSVAHHFSVDALNGRPEANSSAPLPLSFHCRIRSTHFDSVSVMHPTLPT